MCPAARFTASELRLGGRFISGPSTLGAVLAVVTGASRGIGLEVVRQLAARGYTTVLGSRDSAKGERAAAELRLDNVVPAPLDVSDDASVAAFTEWLETEHGRCDVLVNNAAIDYDTDQRATS